jgi:hypothetical protein
MIANNINIKTVKPIKSDIYIYISICQGYKQKKKLKRLLDGQLETLQEFYPLSTLLEGTYAHMRNMFFFFFHINCMIYTLSLNKEFW